MLHVRNVSCQNYVLFINWQQNIGFIKLEKHVDILNEEDSINMSTDEVYKPSPFFIKKAESEVSLLFM
jgi:hypothetical protein